MSCSFGFGAWDCGSLAIRGLRVQGYALREGFTILAFRVERG